jgi:asparaginyl-tRNA synthetase
VSQSEGFCYVHTPILTSNDCEGAGETFRVTTASSGTEDEFFPKPAYLTVSAQLHLEALTSALSRTYTLSPCFRSERSMTNRHLAEFWMLEAEWAFASGGIKSVCDLVEESVKQTLRDALQARESLDVLWKGKKDKRMDDLEDAARPNANWTRMTYTEAVKALGGHHSSSPSSFAFEPAWGKPLQSEHERWLAEQLVNGPLFVTDYPACLKPFYMRANDDGETVACFDLLIPHVGELAGGSVREERLERLVQAMAELSRPEEYDWYLDLRRFGNAGNAGFGLGFERLIAWLSGIENVRECIAMPRWTGKILL